MLHDFRRDPGIGQAADDDIPFTDELPHKQRRPYRNRGLVFAPPESIASLTNGHGRFPQWMGHCPCHDDRVPSLSVRWGRNRNTVIKCHAGCSNEDVLAHFRNLGFRLDPAPPPSKAAPEPEAIARALHRLTRVERAVLDHLAGQDERPARMIDIAKAIGASRRSVTYAIPVLEWLGLTRVRRYRYARLQNGFPTNRYELASDRLFRDLNPDDDALKAELKAVRRGEWPTARHNFGATPPSAKNCTKSYENEVATPPPAPPSRAVRVQRARRRAAARAAGSVLVTQACVSLVEAAGGSWRGTATSLLATLERPAGVRAWPVSHRGLMSRLWLGRTVLQDAGIEKRMEWDGRVRNIRLEFDLATALSR
jgi:hypothetical protein